MDGRKYFRTRLQYLHVSRSWVNICLGSLQLALALCTVNEIRKYGLVYYRIFVMWILRGLFDYGQNPFKVV